MADPIRQELTVPLAKEILAEENAFLVEGTEQTYLSLVGDAEIRRGWKEGVKDWMGQLCDFLDGYTSAQNPSPQRFVEDPQASGETFPGRWRQAYNRPVTQADGTIILMQILRRGYITRLVTDSALDWSEARITQHRDYPTNTYAPTSEVYLEVIFPNISPDAAGSIVESIDGLPADTFTPEVRGHAYGSSYHRIYCTSRTEEDGSCTIILFLGLPEYTLYSYNAWAVERQTDVTYHWNVPKTLAQSVIDAHKATGKSAVANYSTGHGLVDITLYERIFDGVSIIDDVSGKNCDYVETTSYYWGIDKDTAENTYNIPDSVPVGWMYHKRISSNGDGSYNVVITGRQTQYRSYDFYESIVSTLTEQQEYQQLGLTDDDLIPDISTAPNRGLYRRRIRVRDDCSKDITTVEEEGIYAHVPILRTTSGPLSDTYAESDRNADSPIEATDEAAGYIYDIRNTLNEYGTYDTTKVARASKSVTVLDQQVSSGALELAYEDMYHGAANPIQATEDASGYIYDTRNRLTEFGVYDATRRIREARQVDVDAVKTVSTVLNEVESNSEHNAPTPLAADAAEQGKIFRTASRLNAFGMYDNERTVEELTPASFTGKTTGTSSTRGIVTDSYVQQTAPIEAAGASQGVIVRVTNRLGPGGVYDSERVTETSVALDETIDSETTGLSSEETQIYSSSRTAPTAPASVQGVVYGASARYNPDGTFDGALVSSESVESTISVSSQRAALEDRDEIVYQNLRNEIQSPTDSPDVGSIYQVASSLNADETYRGTILHTESQENTLYETWETRHGTASLYRFANHRDMPDWSPLEDDIYNNSLAVGTNLDGTYTGEFRKTPTQDSVSATFWNDQEYQWKYTTLNEGITFGVYIYNTTNLNTAEEWLAITPENNRPGTSINYAGRGRWQAKKVWEI